MAFLLNSQAQAVSGKNEHLPEHYGAGHQSRGSQCSCIGLRPALHITHLFRTGPGNKEREYCFCDVTESLTKATSHNIGNTRGQPCMPLPLQGCKIGSFGAKNMKFGSFEKHLAPEISFGYFLALLQLFRSTNFSWKRIASGTCSLFLPLNSCAMH